MPAINMPTLPTELQSAFTSPKALEELRNFASDSFCEENILFLEQVLQLKKTADASLILPIVSKFIRTDSPCQVNIDSALQEQILQKVQGFRPSSADPSSFDLFDDAFSHIADMVQTDVLPRFKQSHSLPHPSSSPSSHATRKSVVPRGRHKLRAEEPTPAPAAAAPAMVPSSSAASLPAQQPASPSESLVDPRTTWYRGHLLRRKGFFAQWKPFTYMKKGIFLFEFKAGANHVTSEPLTVISLKSCLVEKAKLITGRPNSFLLTTADNRTFFFQAASHEDMEEWIEELGSFSVSPLLKASSSSGSSPTSSRLSLDAPPSASASADASSIHSSTSSHQHHPSHLPAYTPSPSSQSLPHASSSKGFVVIADSELHAALPILGFLESFTDAVVVGDSRGMVVEFNSAACKMFGYTKEEAKHTFLKDLMPEPYSSHHDGYLFRHEKHGEEKLIGKTRNLQGRRKSGEIFELQISLGKLPVRGYFIATIREREPESPTASPDAE